MNHLAHLGEQNKNGTIAVVDDGCGQILNIARNACRKR